MWLTYGLIALGEELTQTGLEKLVIFHYIHILMLSCKVIMMILYYMNMFCSLFADILCLLMLKTV